MNGRVEIDVVLPHPPARVWKALTDSKRLTDWLMPTDFEPRMGFRFGFYPPRGGRDGVKSTIRCKVVEIEQEKRLAYSWSEREDEVPDLVTWTLEAVSEGTRLRLEHTRPEPSTVESGVTAMMTTMLWCGSAIRLQRHLGRGLIMGRAVPAAGGVIARATSNIETGGKAPTKGLLRC